MKGLSQILYLIIAAAVLMMVALTLIFMVQGGIGDVFEGSNRQSCINSVQQACNVRGSGATFEAPSVCLNGEGQSRGYSPSGASISTSGQVTCN